MKTTSGGVSELIDLSVTKSASHDEEREREPLVELSLIYAPIL